MLDLKYGDELKAGKALLDKYGFKNEVDAWHARLSKPYETDYPQPLGRYSLTYQTYSMSMEESYFWILNHLRVDLGFPIAKKVKDVFSASENSSFWGQAQQRLSIQQDRVQQYLATIGKLVKDLFQIVREMRVLDERLMYYTLINSGNAKEFEAADITLKDYWITLVEGGSKNPGSVLGMSTQLGFATLPDLFYQTHVTKIEQVTSKVNALKFNEKVKEVLKRKLTAYLNWKKLTHKELQARRRFQLKYLRQHYDIIMMYISWVRPYLRNVRSLSMRKTSEDDVNLVNAFENALIELEFVALNPKMGKFMPAVLCSFEFIAAPSMGYHQPDNYQAKGPIHVGRLNMQIRSYVWTEEEVNNYVLYRKEQDLEMLSTIDDSLKSVLEEFGDELKNYLEEAGEKVDRPPDVGPSKPPSGLDPFLSIFKGFGDIFHAFVPKGDSTPKASKEDKFKDGKSKKSAKGISMSLTHVLYKNYKKAHRMVQW
jgi:hypothetical protein